MVKDVIVKILIGIREDQNEKIKKLRNRIGFNISKFFRDELDKYLKEFE